MKKLSWILALSLLSISVAAQVPPLYDSEELPSDLAVESKRRAPPKKKEAPKKEETETNPETTVEAPKVEAATGEVTQTKQQVPAAPIELPGSSQPAPVEPAAQPTTAPVPQPAAPAPMPTPVPAPMPVPAPEAPMGEVPTDIPSEAPGEVPVVAAPAMAEAPSDGGPQRDAGNDLTTAMTLSFARYSDNFLSTQDTVDMFKIYARAGESLGVILTPEHPSMQLSVDLLGETGELLTQTQANLPGAPLSFQTSALGTNTTIYIQVRDINLIVQGTAAPELRKYALELRPILAAPTPTLPAPAAEAPEAAKAPEAKPQQEDEESEEASWFAGFFDEPWVLYGAIGIGVLLILLVILMVIRKMRGQKEEEEEEIEEEQHDQQNDGSNPQ